MKNQQSDVIAVMDGWGGGGGGRNVTRNQMYQLLFCLGVLGINKSTVSHRTICTRCYFAGRVHNKKH